MKKLIIFLYIFFALPGLPKAQIQTYTSSSVLKQGKFVKIAVTTTGIYKLTYSDLSSMGVNPADVRIFGYGGEPLNQHFSTAFPDDLPEVAIHMEKGSDGVFNAGDYILFYAKGVNKWTYNQSSDLFTHSLNTYSEKGYYFVSSDAGTGKKIEAKTFPSPGGATVVPIESFTDYYVHEKELYNLANSGKDFYGEIFESVNTFNYSITFPNIIVSQPIRVRLDVAANASTSSTFSMQLDNAQTKQLNVPAFNDNSYQKAMAARGVLSFTPTGNAVNLKLVYNRPNSSARAYLNFFEINAQRKLKLDGTYMPFQHTSLLGSGSYAHYKLSNATASVQIWDVTDAENIGRVETTLTKDTLNFIAPATTLKQFIALDPSQSAGFSKPEIIGSIDNQDLHAMPQAEMLIITHSRFLSQAEKLAQAHRSMDNLRVNVVTNEQVFNEFSSGTPDATAYRRFAKMFYDRAKTTGTTADAPKYLLLFGKGTFDNRKLISTSGENLILTYQADESLNETQSYVTDDYFGFLKDNEGSSISSATLDLGVGRFPVKSTDEADVVVNKTINYMKNANNGKWKNQLCFLADDGDNALHMNQADNIARIVEESVPAYKVTKIYLDAYKQEINASGETYPVARKQMHDQLAKGLLYFNYTGHASALGMSNENIISISDILSLSNTVLPLWVGATCDFLQFDNRTVSAGENVVLNENGGGIGIFSAARPVYANENFDVNRYFTDYLFRKVNGEHYRIGDVLAIAKNKVGPQINKLSYVYMGDPAIKLAYPTKNVVNTVSINNKTTSDTLTALSVAEVKAEVTDLNGTKITDFNGVAYVDVYDKKVSITTQNNNNEGAMTYTDRPNVLFSGKVTVTNGDISFKFMLPKDIKYNFGTGRINYYAVSDNDYYEAQGNYENFIVGGTNPSVEYETDGPEINLYLNSLQFNDGDKVNETPQLIAYINDKNGINKVGSGIGHDILLTLNNDPSQSKVLNDYFESNANSYTDGVLKYKLSSLSDGEYTLTLKAWDLLNNSSEKTIRFKVVNGLTPSIFTVSNYPNPAKDGTTILVSHDRPETVLKTKVEIFNLAGAKLWEFNQNNADQISWDLRAADGRKVRGGLYIYKVSIQTTNSDTYSKSNKLLIIE